MERMTRTQFLQVVIFALAVFTTAVTVTGSSRALGNDTVMIFGPTGAQLLEDCNEMGKLKVGNVVPSEQLASNMKNFGICVGYIVGINDATMAANARSLSVNTASKQNRPPYCLPAGVEIDQMIRVVKKSLEDNPAQLHLPSSVLVIGALRDAFPCR